MGRSVTRVPTVLLLAFVGAGCSATVGDTTPTLDKATAGEKVQASLGKQFGREPDDVTCPDDLEGKVGVEGRCVLTDGGVSYGVTVTVTSVEGKTINFDAVVDKKPQP